MTDPLHASFEQDIARRAGLEAFPARDVAFLFDDLAFDAAFAAITQGVAFGAGLDAALTAFRSEMLCSADVALAQARAAAQLEAMIFLRADKT